MIDDLTSLMFDNATDAGRDIRPGRAQRRDGWTPGRIRTFLQTLARGGNVTAAARAAGLSPKSAYALRNSAKGTAFARAWRLALAHVRRRVVPVVAPLDRSIVRPVMRRGKLWGVRRRPDNPYALRTLRHVDRVAAPPDEAMLRLMENFDAFVDYVAATCAAPVTS